MNFGFLPKKQATYDKSIFLVLFLFGIIPFFFNLSCAYRFGRADRQMPGDHRLFSIPVFVNKSSEPQIEVAFTNAMIREFDKGKVGRLVNPEMAEVEILGVIELIQIKPESEIAYSSNPQLPEGTALASSYNVALTAKITLRKTSDKAVLWSKTVKRDGPYRAALVTQVGVSTVNPLYNLSARRQKIESLAGEMMAEAYDYMTERF